jgi:hypothetical protein
MKLGPGRPKIIEKDPDVLEHVKDFINTRADNFANERRRNDLNFANGFTLAELQDYVLEKKNSENENTLFKMSNKSFRSSEYYSDIFHVKKLPGENTLTKLHADDHYCKAQVKMVINFISYIAKKFNMKDQCLIMSVDDKAKVKIGIPAVSKHVKLRKFFELSKSPKLPDHDFPFGKKYLLVPSGYLELDLMNEEISDKWKRCFFKKPQNGQLHVYNRPFLFTNSNAFTHANDIFNIIQGKQIKPKFLALTCDNGPDFSR